MRDYHLPYVTSSLTAARMKSLEALLLSLFASEDRILERAESIIQPHNQRYKLTALPIDPTSKLSVASAGKLNPVFSSSNEGVIRKRGWVCRFCWDSEARM